MMFSGDGDVRSQATRALLVLAVILLPGSYAFALDGILIGSGRYRELGLAMIGSLIVFLVVVLPIMSADATVVVGLAGVWLALGVWMVARTVMTWRIWTHAVSTATHYNIN
jgi:Na+-driven multidrug efflux pump